MEYTEAEEERTARALKEARTEANEHPGPDSKEALDLAREERDELNRAYIAARSRRSHPY